MLAPVSPWGNPEAQGAVLVRLRFAGVCARAGSGNQKGETMNRSMLAIGGAAGLALALISAPAFPAEAEVCYQSVTTTQVTWNEENYVQTSEEVPATYAP